MGKAYIPKPEARELLEFLFQKFISYELFVDTNGVFYMGGYTDDKIMPMNHIRCLLRHDLHQEYFLTSKQVKRILDSFMVVIKNKVASMGAKQQ